jgi:tRNA G10  N-methylase Trm11
VSADEHAPRLIASDSEERRKRLGQYFTGVDTARLLAELASARAAKRIIDPMVGSADMLIGAIKAGASADVLAGIEIDPIAHLAARERVAGAGYPDAPIVAGDAFSPASLTRLPTLEYDLVITNPPYIRYQSVARAATADISIPSATAIRDGLISCIEMLPALDEADRAIFTTLARSYSGLADIAVPSWILCAGLLAPAGRLAILVPDTWLSRNYAHPVQYLLSRFFDVEFVVADRDAAWFSDALVRTTLVVAKRIPRRTTGFSEDGGHVRFSIGAASRDERSIVGAAYPGARNPDRTFADAARRWISDHDAVPEELHGEWVEHAHTAHSLKAHAGSERWINEVEDAPVRAARTSAAAAPPLPLRAIVKDSCEFTTLDDLGWRTGQGLRTGANLFFYVDADDTGKLRTAKRVGGKVIQAPANVLMPVIRRQNELPDGYRLEVDAGNGRVLILDGYALPEDIVEQHPMQPVSETLADHIRASATTNLGTDGEPRLIAQLSAVAPNSRPFNPAQPERAPRFWYHLPQLADRHRPSLFVARVNYGHPRTLLNPGRSLVVDANFSTLWPAENAAVDEHAILAVLNSSWANAALETGCTVMGGGALKVEAAHLRRLAIPVLRHQAWEKLSHLGQELAEAPDAKTIERALRAIDRVVFTGLAGAKRATEATRATRELAAARRSLRSPSSG